MTPEEFRRAAHEVVDWMADYMAHIRDLPVLPNVAPGDVMRALPAEAPLDGEPIEQILADFRAQIVPANTQWNHPRFHAYFSVSGAPPGILAEMLIATLNVNGMVWKSSPAATELEQVTLGWLRDWLGLPREFFGIIHDTASISTMHALLAAREFVAPESRASGTPPGLIVYTSEHAHSSVEKGAIAVGIGQANVRKVATDDRYRMRPDALEAMIEADRAAGLLPCCVCPTVGTTSIASIDPVAKIGEIARREGMWMHVDGAYGGNYAVVPQMAHLREGWAEADSLVINPHKGLLTPIDLSVFYTRRPEVLRSALSLVPEYLRTATDNQAVNFMDYSVALGHRFRSLKLWFVLRSYGRAALEKLLYEQLCMAQDLADWVRADSRFELAAPVELSLVCFRLKTGDEASRALMDAVNATGHAFLSHTVIDGRFLIRLAIGNYQTTRDDMSETWALIQKLAGG
ncbi:MAG: pyridoxal-dependent decarboxylase [Acidobacteriota bacterium]